MGIFADFTAIKVFSVIRMVLGIHLLILGNYSELEILKSFGVLTGIDESKIEYLQIGTFFFGYFFSWAAVVDKFVIYTNEIIIFWAVYGLVMMCLSYVAYDNAQIFYLLYLLFKERKKSQSIPHSGSKYKQEYKKIKLYFILVVVFDWSALILWMFGFLLDSREFIRIGESFLGLHVLLFGLCFHQIKTFAFLGKKDNRKNVAPEPTAVADKTEMLVQETTVAKK